MLPLLEGNGTRSYTSLTPVNPTVGKDYIMHYDVVSKEFEYWRYKEYSEWPCDSITLQTASLFMQCFKRMYRRCLRKVANPLRT
jgi:hypothetical protein